MYFLYHLKKFFWFYKFNFLKSVYKKYSNLYHSFFSSGKHFNLKIEVVVINKGKIENLQCIWKKIQIELNIITKNLNLTCFLFFHIYLIIKYLSPWETKQQRICSRTDVFIFDKNNFCCWLKKHWKICRIFLGDKLLYVLQEMWEEVVVISKV